MLKFLGRGAGFSDEHNGACFGLGNKLILMDCPLVTFKRLKNEGPEKFANCDKVEELVAVITHTHSDHVGGLALSIHFAKFVWNIPVTVVAPSEEVQENLDYLLNVLDGCSKENYKIVTVEEYMKDAGKSWMKAVIPTKHVPALDGRCFGYNLEIDKTNVIYTGDTRSLDAYMDYLSPGTVLYTECSAYKTEVHIYVDDLVSMESFFKNKGVTVYLMHMDEEREILEKTKETAYQPVPLA